MKRIVTVLLGIALMLTMAVAMTGCGKKDAQTAENTAPQVTSTQKADEAKKAEEAKKASESKQPQNSVKPSQSPAPSADQATGSPVQRYSGRWGSGRCTVDVIGEANNSVVIKVSWGSSASERAEWTMSGNFDEDGSTVYYTDGVKKIVTFNEDGSVKSTEEVYVGGKGSFIFKDNTMTWEDLAEHMADGMTFTK